MYYTYIYILHMDTRIGFVIPNACNLLQSRYSERLLLYYQNIITVKMVFSNNMINININYRHMKITITTINIFGCIGKR